MRRPLLHVSVFLLIGLFPAQLEFDESKPQSGGNRKGEEQKRRSLRVGLHGGVAQETAPPKPFVSRRQRGFVDYNRRQVNLSTPSGVGRARGARRSNFLCEAIAGRTTPALESGACLRAARATRFFSRSLLCSCHWRAPPPHPLLLPRLSSSRSSLLFPPARRSP